MLAVPKVVPVIFFLPADLCMVYPHPLPPDGMLGCLYPLKILLFGQEWKKLSERLLFLPYSPTIKGGGVISNIF